MLTLLNIAVLGSLVFFIVLIIIIWIGSGYFDPQTAVYISTISLIPFHVLFYFTIARRVYTVKKSIRSIKIMLYAMALGIILSLISIFLKNDAILFATVSLTKHLLLIIMWAVGMYIVSICLSPDVGDLHKL